MNQSSNLKAMPIPPEVLADLSHGRSQDIQTLRRLLSVSPSRPELRWRICSAAFGCTRVNSLYELACEMTRFEISSVV
jgi:hypothetical protein